MNKHKSIPLIQILTRPATVFGLTYNYFGLLCVISSLFIFTTKLYVFSLLMIVILYIFGRWLAEYDQHWLEGFLVLRQKCKYQKNQNYWGCRSYAPW